MTILAQHGWGKSDKIERGIADGSLEGVIMSPRDERPSNLASFLSDLSVADPSLKRFVDPQLHAGTIQGARDGRLPCYEHYRRNLVPSSFSPAAIQELVTEALNWQNSLEVSHVVSPTVSVDDLGGRWAQIALMLAQETVARFNGNKPLLISLVVREDALRQLAPIDNWLDELTRLDVDGFYLVVFRNSDMYRQHYDPEVLSSLMRVCYSLGELNQYRVFVGYSDMATLLLHAVGVTGTAAGWYANLKQFTMRRFEPISGGRRARPRYSSRPLLNSIYMTELDGIYNGGQLPQVLSGTSHDGSFNANTNPENVPWPDNTAALHHWAVLADISQSLQGNTVGDRLDSARNIIGQAQAVYTQAGTLVPFANETGPTHLDQWLDALNRFRADAGV